MQQERCMKHSLHKDKNGQVSVAERPGQMVCLNQGSPSGQNRFYQLYLINGNITFLQLDPYTCLCKFPNKD